MAESLRHLHLLVQLQADSFQETLDHHVSIELLFEMLIMTWKSPNIAQLIVEI